MTDLLKNAAFEEIYENVALYKEMVKALKSSGFRTLCNCGKQQKTINIRTFLDNKLKILNVMETVKNRTITPKFKGVLFSSRAMKHFNAATLSDDAILNIVKNGWLSKDMFDFSKYKGNIEQEEAEEKEVVPEPSEEAVSAPAEEEVVSEPSEEKPDNLDDIIMDMYNSGLKPKEIAEKLNSEGFVYKEGRAFNSSSVSSIIKKRK